MKNAILAAAVGFGVFACSASEDQKGSSSATATAEPPKTSPPPMTATATATATAAPSKPLASNAVVIDSLKLAIEPPPGTSGSAHEMKEGIILHFSGNRIALTVSEAHGDLAYAKKHRETDPGFQKWVTETEDTAVAEMLVDKKKEYYGFKNIKIGDKTYECGTLTMIRRSSPDEKAVRSALALCDGLRAK
jgi:hypothetical protein